MFQRFLGPGAGRRELDGSRIPCDSFRPNRTQAIRTSAASQIHKTKNAPNSEEPGAFDTLT